MLTLLETKLYMPRSHGALVSRPRLAERLDRGATSTLTLVSAPAGFGKSTLLAQWLAARSGAGSPAASAASAALGGPPRAAWLSLERADNQPVTFWTYVIAALRTAAPGIGVAAEMLLQAPQPAPIEAVLTALLNDLDAIAADIVLVLDDYHLIEASDVQHAMAFLLEHLPRRLHLVIAGRADPPLPLARLRAGGELVEVRALDLRFTPAEAAAYLNAGMGLRLSAADVAALEGRTEGWIAALQLAALSIQGRPDVAGFISGFAGDDRYVVDYLVEEVLQRQSARVQAFLLQTSILGRLSGPLCDAVTGEGGSRARLEALDRGNLFVVPLDDQRRWYRYHHLFAEVLHARLLDEQPDRVPELHRRASSWYEQNGEPSIAVQHALAGRDFDRAADLIELSIPALRRDRQEGTLIGWLQELPEELVRLRPLLSIGYAWALLSAGDVEGVEARLRDAERWLGTTPGERAQRSAELAALDDGEFRRLPRSIALFRAAQALALGDVASTASNARQARELAPEQDHLGRGAAAGLLGLAAWTSGDLAEAHRSYTECTASLLRAGHVADTFGCAIALADIRTAQGRLREAMGTYEQALRLSSAQAGPVLRGTADLHVGLSELHREQGDLQAAGQHLLRSQELGEHLGLPQNRYRGRLAMARIRQARGDLDGALDLLSEAEEFYVADFFPNVRPVPAWRARVWLAQGRLGAALDWAREQGVSVADPLSYLHEFEHVTLAGILVARCRIERPAGALREATDFLERLLRAAREGERTGAMIEILVLQALAHQVRGDLPAALLPLEHALILAEPQGYVQTIIEAGAPVQALLKVAAAQGVLPNYVRRLLAAPEPSGASPAAQALVDPLSERELDVLRLLASDLSGPGIARELTVSVNTVRTHTKSIYAKLGVNSRRAAVRRGEELDLPSRTRNR